MKQYCRYCAYLVNETYCEACEKELSNSYVRRAHNCKDFRLRWKCSRRVSKKISCDICKRESISCNRYLMEDGRTITICPPCLVNGDGYLARLARKAHEQGRKI